MQKFNPLLIALLGLLFFIACQKEISSGSSNATGSFVAKVDSAAWEANLFKSIARMNGTIAIVGQSSSKKLITMRVADSGVHNYTFYSASATNAAIYVDSASGNSAAFVTNQWPAAGVYGTLSITNIDTVNKVMSGNFSFRAYRLIDSASHTISSGVFTNIPYITATVTPPTPAGPDTFRANLNGVNFAYASFSASRPPGQGLISMGGYNGGIAGVPSLGLAVPDTIGVGTKSFEFFGTYTGLYNLDFSNTYAADSGTLVVNEHNTATRRFRGTFNFRAVKFIAPRDTVRVTEGYFSVTYQ